MYAVCRFLFFMALPLLASAQTSATTQDAALHEVNRRYDKALVEADAAALRKIYAAEFTYIGPNAVVRDKDEQIHALTSGKVDVLAGRSDDVAMRIYGASAVVTGRFIGRARVSGKTFWFRERYSTFWHYSDGAWRLVLEHGTVVPETDEPAHPKPAPNNSFNPMPLCGTG